MGAGVFGFWNLIDGLMDFSIAFIEEGFAERFTEYLENYKSI
jgi:hypothetical protein